jgi:hypothetical protein
MQSAHLDASEVSIEVKDGKVTLEGTVPERRMKHAIEDMADACPGVSDVENRLRVAQGGSHWGSGGSSGPTSMGTGSTTHGAGSDMGGTGTTSSTSPGGSGTTGTGGEAGIGGASSRQAGSGATSSSSKR